MSEQQEEDSIVYKLTRSNMTLHKELKCTVAYERAIVAVQYRLPQYFLDS